MTGASSSSAFCIFTFYVACTFVLACLTRAQNGTQPTTDPSEGNLLSLSLSLSLCVSVFCVCAFRKELKSYILFFNLSIVFLVRVLYILSMVVLQLYNNNNSLQEDMGNNQYVSIESRTRKFYLFIYIFLFFWCLVTFLDCLV